MRKKPTRISYPSASRLRVVARNRRDLPIPLAMTLLLLLASAAFSVRAAELDCLV